MIYGFEPNEEYRWYQNEDSYARVIKAEESPDAWFIWVRWYRLDTDEYITDQKNLGILKANLKEWEYGKSGPH